MYLYIWECAHAHTNTHTHSEVTTMKENEGMNLKDSKGEEDLEGGKRKMR